MTTGSEVPKQRQNRTLKIVAGVIGYILVWKFIMFPLNAWTKAQMTDGNVGLGGLVLMLIVGALNLLMIVPIALVGGYYFANFLKKSEDTLFGDVESMTELTPEQIKLAQQVEAGIEKHRQQKKRDAGN